MSELDAYRKAHPDENEALDAGPRLARPSLTPPETPAADIPAGVFIGSETRGGGRMRKIPARTRKPTKEDVDDAPPPARLAYRVDEACALLGVSRDTIERAVKA